MFSRLQHWIDSDKGQTFINFAYSWGASIVIIGTLFKLVHISSADIFLYIGMGTEVIVFFISGFDRPWKNKEQNLDIKKLNEILSSFSTNTTLPYRQSEMISEETAEAINTESQELLRHLKLLNTKLEKLFS